MAEGPTLKLYNLAMEGDSNAMNKLFLTIQPQLKFLARRYTDSNCFSPEDYVQQSNLHILKAMGQFDPSRADFKTFAYRIAQTTMIRLTQYNALRWKTERKGVGLEVPEIENFLEDLENSETLEVILSEMDNLPPLHRTIVFERVVEGKPLRHISREHHKDSHSGETVCGRWYRKSIKVLRDQLSGVQVIESYI
jgi:RNA polymerase sigma factor (sigma-70 family)